MSPAFDFVSSANMLLRQHAGSIAGPLTAGHYVQIGMGMGFYVPEADFERLQTLANQTHKVQFLGITRAGAPLTGTREAILEHPDSAGLVAWIVPQDSPASPPAQEQERGT